MGNACQRVIVDLQTTGERLTKYMRTADAGEKYLWDEKEALIEDIKLKDLAELIFKVRTLNQARN